MKHFRICAQALSLEHLGFSPTINSINTFSDISHEMFKQHFFAVYHRITKSGIPILCAQTPGIALKFLISSI